LLSDEFPILAVFQFRIYSKSGVTFSCLNFIGLNLKFHTIKRIAIPFTAIWVVTILTLPATSAQHMNARYISDKPVPEVVKSALQKSYPDAKHIRWEKEESHYEAEFYEAGFTVNQTHYSLSTNGSGTVWETEIEIKPGALPAKAKEYISKNMQDRRSGKRQKSSVTTERLLARRRLEGKTCF
jgi:hypothetical protein